MKFVVAVVATIFCQGSFVTGIVQTDEQRVLFGGRPLTNWHKLPTIREWDDHNDVELDDIQVYKNFLKLDELALYKSYVDKTFQGSYRMEGLLTHDVELLPQVIKRLDALRLGKSAEAESCEQVDADSAAEPVMVEVAKLTRSFPLHADHHNQGTGAIVHGHTALLVLKDSHHSFVWGDSTRVPLVENSLIVFRGNTTHGIPLFQGQDNSEDSVHYLGPFSLSFFDPVGCGPGVASDCGEGEEFSPSGGQYCYCGTMQTCAVPVCAADEICDGTNCVSRPQTCQCNVQCGIPFILTGACEMEGILECDGVSLPSGATACAQCETMQGQPRKLGRRGKGKSSSTTLPATPEQFSLTLDIPGFCEQMGTYNALGATTSCITPFGTYTLSAYVEGYLPENSSTGKSSRRRARGLQNQDNNKNEIGTVHERTLRMMKKKTSSTKSSTEEPATQTCSFPPPTM